VNTTRFAATAIAVAGSLVLVAALGGCASSAGGSTNTLAKAKATTLSVETKMASFIPKSSILSMNQPKQSKVLFPCLKKENQSYWPSTMTVSVKAGLNTSNILDSIGSYWTNKNGWTVSNSTAADGTPTMSVVSDSGYNFTAEFAQGPVFTVTAISSCFPSAGLAGKSSY
jgi:hypothetical protein